MKDLTLCLLLIIFLMICKSVIASAVLCCSAEVCRKRILPASCRFWDRKVYWGVVILALVTLQQGRREGYSASKLMRLFQVSRHTLKRWMSYFRKDFTLTNRWKRIKGYIGFEVSGDLLPRAIVLLLIERMGSGEQGLITSLQLLLGGEKLFDQALSSISYLLPFSTRAKNRSYQLP
ncbi:hypothetical protein KJ966_27170 [bacterium]|nr:hypothetical protein [bacterium]